MINKLELNKLPYVDECPEVDQKRIQWVRNGDCLGGSTTKYGNDGNLNASGVGLYNDVLVLQDNGNKAKDSINIIIDNVNNINKALEIGSDTEIVAQIGINKENIEILQVHMQFAENNIGELYTTTNFLKEDVGVYDPSEDSVYRPVRDDLVFIKTEMGSYPNQDINGQPVDGHPSSGMKRRIIDNSSAIVQTIARVKKLEDDYQDSDVGSLSIKLNEIREELGPKTQVVGKPNVYTRIDTLETTTATSSEDINSIKTAIGFNLGSSINTRVTTLEGQVTTLNTTVSGVNGLTVRTTKLETAVGTDLIPLSINGRLATLRTDHDALSNIVGKDSSSGLRGQVTWMSQAIGTEVSPAPGTIQFKIAALTVQGSQNSNAIQNIQADIGNNNTGIKGQVLTLKRQMDGTNPNGITVEERGVLLSTKQLEIKIVTKLDDAPSDGVLYGRKNSAWIEIPSAAIEAEVEALQTDVGLLKTKTDATNLEVSSNKSEIALVKTSIESNTASINTLKTDVSGNTTSLETLTTKVGTIETNLGVVKTESGTNKDNIEALTTLVGDIESGLVPVKADVTANKADIVTIKASIETLETSVSSLESGLSAVTTTADTNKTDLVTVKADIVTLKADVAQLKIDVANKIDEAPKDNEAYVRKDGAWVLLSGFLTP